MTAVDVHDVNTIWAIYNFPNVASNVCWWSGPGLLLDTFQVGGQRDIIDAYFTGGRKLYRTWRINCAKGVRGGRIVKTRCCAEKSKLIFSAKLYVNANSSDDAMKIHSLRRLEFVDLFLT